MFPTTKTIDLPRSAEVAADLLLSELTLQERSRLSAMGAAELRDFENLVGETIVTEFRLWDDNDALLRSCLLAARTVEGRLETPAMVIIRRMWEKLQRTHVLRVIR